MSAPEKMADLEFSDYFGERCVTFCDERRRAGKGIPVDDVCSVTLSSADGDESWGEFLDRSNALALYAWLGLLLGHGAPGETT